MMGEQVLPKKFQGWGSLNIVWFIFVLIAGVSSFYGLQQDSQRFWLNFLLQYFLWLSISLGGVFFVALQYLTGSAWSVVLRRVAEAFIGFLPIAFILFVVFFFTGFKAIFPAIWKTVPLKSAYLNEVFFGIRHVALFVVVLFFGGWIVRNSLLQDKTGDAKLTPRNGRLAPLFVFFFGWLFTFASFDLLLSLSPKWFSTIFGIYCWSGLFCSALAMITIFVILLRKMGYLRDWVTEDHLHDLGKLLFAFLVFWAYVAFSQFLLIWYSNLPEENFYFVNRLHFNWDNISLALVFIRFIVPFFLLLSRPSKRSENILFFIASWFVLAHVFELYWIIFPEFYHTPPGFRWIDASLFFGFIGLFFLSVGFVLKRVSIVPIRDPKLEESLHHHQ